MRCCQSSPQGSAAIVSLTACGSGSEGCTNKSVRSKNVQKGAEEGIDVIFSSECAGSSRYEVPRELDTLEPPTWPSRHEMCQAVAPMTLLHINGAVAVAVLWAGVACL